MQQAGVKRNTITYNAAIQACQRGGAWQEAVHLAQQMQAQRIPRDTITFNSLIRACEGAGQWQTAFDFMKEMKMDEMR